MRDTATNTPCGCRSYIKNAAGFTTNWRRFSQRSNLGERSMFVTRSPAPRWWRVFVFLIMPLLIVPFSQVDAKTYKWKDENGKLHFTDDPTKVPKKIPAPPPAKTNADGLDESIFLECKATRGRLTDTTTFRFNPTIPELIWVKDTDGLEIKSSKRDLSIRIK